MLIINIITIVIITMLPIDVLYSLTVGTKYTTVILLGLK